MADAHREICLYGTDQVLPAPRLLTAGPVSVEFENGALRHIRYDGIEVVRAIAFLARDVNWGTYGPEMADIEVVEADGGFRVSYRARCRDATQSLNYTASITGAADGTLAFDVTGVAETDFATNRTGFVVLHPAGLTGQPLTVSHTDGRREETAFPEIISPGQPVFDIRALAHTVCPGVVATCTMSGDAFEMEDQRNWTDASYKTYVRPLGKPWPYTIAAGTETVQSVRLEFAGAPTQATAGAGGGPVTVTVGEATGGAMPRIGVALTAADARVPGSVVDGLTGVAPQLLVCHVDLRGEGLAALKGYADIAAGVKAPAMLELIVPEAGDPADAARTAAEAVRDVGLRLESVLIGPAEYLMSIQPDGDWPDLPPLEVYATAARQAFPDTPVGGGMFSYFTEMNRKRPPAGAVDYISHTTCPIVHDPDDRSVMESMEMLPAMIASVRAMAGDTPYRVGPSTIGMRQNPYGAAPMENPDNVRVAMAREEPRHRGLFGAAWAIGYAAAMVRGGVTDLTLSGAGGPFGLFRGTDPADGVLPLYHVVRGLAAGAGKEARSAVCDDDTRVAALAFGGPDDAELWLANLGPEPVEVVVEGAGGAVQMLDVANFERATTSPDGFRTTATPMSGPTVRLDGHAVARVNGS